MQLLGDGCWKPWNPIWLVCLLISNGQRHFGKCNLNVLWWVWRVSNLSNSAAGLHERSKRVVRSTCILPNWKVSGENLISVVLAKWSVLQIWRVARQSWLMNEVMTFLLPSMMYSIASRVITFRQSHFLMWKNERGYDFLARFNDVFDSIHCDYLLTKPLPSVGECFKSGSSRGRKIINYAWN